MYLYCIIQHILEKTWLGDPRNWDSEKIIEEVRLGEDKELSRTLEVSARSRGFFFVLDLHYIGYQDEYRERSI